MYSIEVGVLSMPLLYRFDVVFDLVILSDRMVSFVCKASLFQPQRRVNIPFHINNRISVRHLNTYLRPPVPHFSSIVCSMIEKMGINIRPSVLNSNLIIGMTMKQRIPIAMETRMTTTRMMPMTMTTTMRTSPIMSICVRSERCRHQICCERRRRKDHVQNELVSFSFVQQ